MFRRGLLLCAALATAAGWLVPTPAAAALPARYVAAWQPYWIDSEIMLAAPRQAPGLFSELSPFMFEAKADGSIDYHDVASGPRRTAALIAGARQLGLPVLPSITDGSGVNGMQTILNDPASRAAHIANIVKLVTDFAVDGIDLDYENFAFVRDASSWPINAPAAPWVAFVSELSTALHAQGKLLSVTIPPVWGVSWDYKIYAPELIHPYVDRLRLMVYDWSVGSPGPIAPLTWVDQVIAKMKALGVPAAKLQLGVPSYGRHWRTKAPNADVCPVNALGRRSVTSKAYASTTWPVRPVRDGSGELKLVWDEQVSGYAAVTPTPPPVSPPGPPPTGVDAGQGVLQTAQRLSPVTTWVTCTVRNTVFMSDEVSIRARADKAAAAGWRGIALWALGYETPAALAALAG